MILVYRGILFFRRRLPIVPKGKAVSLDSFNRPCSAARPAFTWERQPGYGSNSALPGHKNIQPTVRCTELTRKFKDFWNDEYEFYLAFD